MKKTLTNLGIFITVVVIAGYAFLSVQAQDSLLVETSSGSNADIVAQKFINQINILSSVRIDTNFFADKSFQSFKDWSREIPAEQKGRTNPFAPIN